MIRWPSTALSERLGITYPILQAPLGSACTPALTAAVSNAGGLGCLDASALEPEAIRAAIREVRELTDRPFAVGLSVPQPTTEDAERIIRANELLARYRQELELPEEEPLAAYAPNYTEQLGVLFEESVKIVSFNYGVPGAKELESLKQLGVVTLGTATHLLEAIVLEESGIDVVIAQGFEAGGQRGTFVGDYRFGLVGSMVLVPLLADHLSVPVVAGGGITDGRGVVAALALGAGGVQLGTALLATPESGAHPSYKERLRQGTEIATTLSRVYSGRPARGLKNRMTRELSAVEDYMPGYPIQNALTREIRRAATQRSEPELMPLWAGQGCAACQERPAAELIADWVAQVNALLLGRRRLAGTARP